MRLFQEQLRKTVSFSGGETVREIEFIPAEFEEIPLRAHFNNNNYNNITPSDKKLNLIMINKFGS